MRSLLKYWLPVLIWVCLIFLGSTDMLSAEQTSRFLVPLLRWLDPQISVATIATIHFAVRKLGHLIEYAILAMLFWRALRRGTNLQMKMSTDPAEPGSSFNQNVMAGEKDKTEGAGRSSLVDSTGCPWVRNRSILSASVWVVCAIFAATDEFHQSFVPSRTASPIDVLIDVCGALIGLAISLTIAARKQLQKI